MNASATQSHSSTSHHQSHHSHTSHSLQQGQHLPTPNSGQTIHILHWFRRDLRVHDNTALAYALAQAVHHASTNVQASNAQVSAVFVVTPEQWARHDMALVQVDFILRTLQVLQRDLYLYHGIKLHVLNAPTYAEGNDLLVQFCTQHGITQVVANAEYEINEQYRDTQLATRLAALNIAMRTFDDQCVLPPHTVSTADGKMYQVFTPFYRNWQNQLHLCPPVLYDVSEEFHLRHSVNKPTSSDDDVTNASGEASLSPITSLDNNWLAKAEHELRSLHYRVLTDYPALLPPVLLDNTLPINTGTNARPSVDLSSHKQPFFDYAPPDQITIDQITIDQTTLEQATNIPPALDLPLAHCRAHYPAGEQAARQRLDAFVASDIQHYDTARDRPAMMATSQLSAYLAIGALSPRLCYLTAYEALTTYADHSTDIQRWISELAWRDFYRHVLAVRPDMVKGESYKPELDTNVPWRYEATTFSRWCQGMTGVPLVDAAMRCLNATGWMHNRLRMVVAMYLTKNLLIDWRLGERYFMQCLIDGDFASNNGGWQWSASTGTDAAPYFRIMNPFSQAKSHDADGVFIKQWVPELASAPLTVLHDEAKLQAWRVTHNSPYPAVMVDGKVSRSSAIATFKIATSAHQN